jgi:hypothetical protein
VTVPRRTTPAPTPQRIPERDRHRAESSDHGDGRSTPGGDDGHDGSTSTPLPPPPQPQPGDD